MIRLAPVLFGLLALTAAASSEPLDNRTRPGSAVEAARAPEPDNTGVAKAADPGAPADGSHRDLGAQDGNPLWRIPLSALAATRDRPLFSASRRPPASEAQAPPAPPPPDPGPVAPGQPEQPDLKLIGTIIGPKATIAMVRDSGTQAVSRLREGESTSGWRLKTVKSRSIVVEKNDQSAILALPQPLDSSESQPGQNPLAFGDRRNTH
jgi:general secretion pathway protein N